MLQFLTDRSQTDLDDTGSTRRREPSASTEFLIRQLPQEGGCHLSASQLRGPFGAPIPPGIAAPRLPLFVFDLGAGNVNHRIEIKTAAFERTMIHYISEFGREKAGPTRPHGFDGG